MDRTFHLEEMNSLLRNRILLLEDMVAEFRQRVFDSEEKVAGLREYIADLERAIQDDNETPPAADHYQIKYGGGFVTSVLGTEDEAYARAADIAAFYGAVKVCHPDGFVLEMTLDQVEE